MDGITYSAGLKARLFGRGGDVARAGWLAGLVGGTLCNSIFLEREKRGREMTGFFFPFLPSENVGEAGRAALTPKKTSQSVYF